MSCSALRARQISLGGAPPGMSMPGAAGGAAAGNSSLPATAASQASQLLSIVPHHSPVLLPSLQQRSAACGCRSDAFLIAKQVRAAEGLTDGQGGRGLRLKAVQQQRQQQRRTAAHASATAGVRTVVSCLVVMPALTRRSWPAPQVRTESISGSGMSYTEPEGHTTGLKEPMLPSQPQQLCNGSPASGQAAGHAVPDAAAAAWPLAIPAELEAQLHQVQLDDRWLMQRIQRNAAAILHTLQQVRASSSLLPSSNNRRRAGTALRRLHTVLLQPFTWQVLLRSFTTCNMCLLCCPLQAPPGASMLTWQLKAAVAPEASEGGVAKQAFRQVG